MDAHSACPVILVLLASACVDDPRPGGSGLREPGAPDGDSDGYTVSDGDGDDSDPEAVEACDGLDNDGDGLVDEGFDDSDGDGVADCMAVEACDGLDNDGDGRIDEGFDDADSDGWATCVGDCDDHNSAIHPGSDEVCANGIDNDCDGNAGPCGLGGERSLSLAGARFHGEAADDFAGSSVDGLGDVDGDGYDEVLVSAPNNADAAPYAGAIYVLYGPQSGDVNLSAATTRLFGARADHAGSSAGSAGDYDGDGTPDVFVGAYTEDSGGRSAGAVYVLTNVSTGDASVEDATTKFTGESEGDWAGQDAAGVGDSDGDGMDEIVIGAMWEDEGEPSAGAAYLVGAVTGEVTLADCTAKFLGESSDDWVGLVASAGDVDGDGIDDLAIGACGENSGGVSAGAVYLVLLPRSGTVDLGDADAKVAGWSSSDEACIPGRVGDLDGDGVHDLAVGAPGANGSAWDAGAIYLFFSFPPTVGAVTSADAQVDGVATDDAMGRSFAAGDINGDGKGDLVVGAPAADDAGSNAGAVYAVLGPLGSGSTPAESDGLLTGESAGNEAGSDVAVVGDTDGDGFADVLVGAPSAAGHLGAAYLVLGGPGW